VFVAATTKHEFANHWVHLSSISGTVQRGIVQSTLQAICTLLRKKEQAMSTATMEDWNSDLIFHVIRYLNVRDMASFSRQSRRMYYLIHQYRILRGPQLISVASYCGNDSSEMKTYSRNYETRQQRNNIHYTYTEIYHQAISKLQGPPRLALSFTTTDAAAESINDSDGSTRTLHELLQTRNPSDTVVLGAIADTIQTTGIQRNHDPLASTKKGRDNTACECLSSNALMMLAGLPSNTAVQPFMISLEDYPTVHAAETFANTKFCHQTDWKMFIMYVVGDGVGIADAFIRTIQMKFPNVTIVGGISTAAYVSMPNVDRNKSLQEIAELYETHELLDKISDLCGGLTWDESMTHKDVAEYLFNLVQNKEYALGVMGLNPDRRAHGICGVALAGDVPIRSVVSRGVESLVSKYHSGDGIPSSSTTLYVHESETVRFNDEGYMLSGESPPPYHLIHKIRDDADGKIYTIDEIIRTYGHSDFIGLRFSNQDGFLLETPHPISVRLNAFLMIASSGINEDATLTGANVDFFDLSGKQCMYDMTYCMEQLRIQTSGEEILGAVMFSCNGRGPHAGMFITDSMADAKRFANVFPDVPCLGFYAGGEIGPLALAGRQSVFQQGNACVQGFTAVFALFIVPPFNWESTRKLDDSDASVTAFIENRFHPK
jgi:small ligand-binding sensory domain FIST